MRRVPVPSPSVSRPDDNAYQAFFEAMPVVRSRHERDRIYSAVQLGRHAELLLLDTRQYRDPQPCDDEDPPSAPPCLDVNRPGRTMLGAQQKAWLKARLDRTPPGS